MMSVKSNCTSTREWPELSVLANIVVKSYEETTVDTLAMSVSTESESQFYLTVIARNFSPIATQ